MFVLGLGLGLGDLDLLGTVLGEDVSVRNPRVNPSSVHRESAAKGHSELFALEPRSGDGILSDSDGASTETEEEATDEHDGVLCPTRYVEGWPKSIERLSKETAEMSVYMTWGHGR